MLIAAIIFTFVLMLVSRIYFCNAFGWLTLPPFKQLHNLVGLYGSNKAFHTAMLVLESHLANFPDRWHVQHDYIIAPSIEFNNVEIDIAYAGPTTIKNLTGSRFDYDYFQLGLLWQLRINHKVRRVVQLTRQSKMVEKNRKLIEALCERIEADNPINTDCLPVVKTQRKLGL